MDGYVSKALIKTELTYQICIYIYVFYTHILRIGKKRTLITHLDCVRVSFFNNFVILMSNQLQPSLGGNPGTVTEYK